MKTLIYNLLIIPFVFSNAVAQVTLFQEDFNGGIGTFTAVDISDATDVWGPNTGYMQVNGFGGSNDEDWLISPAINMDTQIDEYLMFDYNDLYSGGLLELYYSVDYNNGATPVDVGAATWVNIPLKLLDINTVSCFSTLFQRHPAVDISAIVGTSVFFAFKYTGTSGTSKQYKIDNFHIEADYYSTLLDGSNCAVLKTALHDIIVNQTDRIRYTSSLYDVWDAILHTDTRVNDASSSIIVMDMFTDFPITTGEFEFDHCSNRDAGSCAAGEGICYNREHSFPRSWWGGGTTLSDTINTDMHHIYASDRMMNTAKSNYPPGEVTTPLSTGSNGVTFGSNGSYPCASMNYFEPIDEYKGDYARTFFYAVTRYEHNMVAWETINARGDCFMDGLTYPSIEPWALTVLLQWHAADPVSQKEIDHNNAVYAIQGNRNPYIDEPVFVYLVWGNETGLPCTTTALPVELSDFNAINKDDAAFITWTTLSELNNDYFEIERSNDLENWTRIGEENGKGNSNETVYYYFDDLNPKDGINYYRLKQIDFDGNSIYSNVKSVTFNSIIQLYPNPVEDRFTLSGESILKEKLQLFDMLGRDLSSIINIDIINDRELNVNVSNLNPGMYILKMGSYKKTIYKK